MTININGPKAQDEALPKIGKYSLCPLQRRAIFDAWASNALVVIHGGSER